MNHYDHEDAFTAANRCAGRKLEIGVALKTAESQNQARVILLELQKQHLNIFEAFIEGVAYGRENPLTDASVTRK